MEGLDGRERGHGVVRFYLSMGAQRPLVVQMVGILSRDADSMRDYLNQLRFFGEIRCLTESL